MTPSSDLGYFNRANVQSSMTGYLQKMEKEEGTHSFRSCIFTIHRIPLMLSHLWATTVEDGGEPPVLPSANVKPHNHTITAEMERVIREKYNLDLELWELITDSQHNGILCV